MARILAGFALLAVVLVAAGGCGDDSGSNRANDGSGPSGAEDASTPSGAWTLGRWEGELGQKGLAPFMVWATVRSLEDANANGVRYSGLGCRGRWVPLGGGGGTYRFREEITAGRSETCKGVGIVTLRRLDGEQAAYTFRGGGIESQGTLTQTDGGE
jgi:hypothetical protein